LQQKEATDSTKNIALKNISKATEALDLLTFNHFYKVRLLCNTTQQKKFNEIINEVVKMMANRPRPKQNRDGNSELPPPNKPEED
jgi:periplasmic protein CpxP/Spy